MSREKDIKELANPCFHDSLLYVVGVGMVSHRRFAGRRRNTSLLSLEKFSCSISLMLYVFLFIIFAHTRVYMRDRQRGSFHTASKENDCK